MSRRIHPPEINIMVRHRPTATAAKSSRVKTLLLVTGASLAVLACFGHAVTFAQQTVAQQPSPEVAGERAIANKPAAGETLRVPVRYRKEVAAGTGRFHLLQRTEEWSANETAVVVCDMWDKHWCNAATARVAEMTPRVNSLLTHLRSAGATIIHCPSDTLDFYKDYPARKRALAAPVVEPVVPLQRWCHIQPEKEGPLPIDDSDGGCDSGLGESSQRVWSRQIAGIEIHENDAITDSAEAYYLMRQVGIRNVIVLGVHTNMCVLGRPFGIRQLVAQGLNVVLARDLTDTMYNPEKSPFVSHFSGTDLVVEHIERHWCGSVLSGDLMQGALPDGEATEFRFAGDTRPHVVLVSAEDEYQTEQTLTEFARNRLQKWCRVTCVYSSNENKHNVPGLEVLASADVCVLSIRRRPLPEEQLIWIRDYVATGRPVVAIRTSSHAFVSRNGSIPEGLSAWPEFDRDVLGGNYIGHHGNREGSAPRTRVWPIAADSAVSIQAAEQIAKQAVKPLAGKPGDDAAASRLTASPSELATMLRSRHASILQGIDPGKTPVPSWLYKVSPLQPDVLPIMTGQVDGDANPEPVSWIRVPNPGVHGWVFYTSLGHAEEFAGELLPRLLENMIHAAAEK